MYQMDKNMVFTQLPRKENDENGLRLLHPKTPLKIVRAGINNEPRHRGRIPLPSFTSTHLKPILRMNKKSEKIADFRLWSHTPAQVSAALVHFLPTHENLTKVSITTMGKAFSLIRKYNEMRSCPNQNPEDANLLTEYLHLFDKLYFCGAIGTHVYVEVAPRGTEGLLMDDYGDFSSHREGTRWKPRADSHGRIRIADLSQSQRFVDPEKRLHHYLGTLLHEALHAVFELYVCFRHCGCKERERRYMGEDGHGWLFEELALLLECASEELPGGELSIV